MDVLLTTTNMNWPLATLFADGRFDSIGLMRLERDPHVMESRLFTIDFFALFARPHNTGCSRLTAHKHSAAQHATASSSRILLPSDAPITASPDIWSSVTNDS